MSLTFSLSPLSNASPILFSLKFMASSGINRLGSWWQYGLTFK